MSNIVTYGQIAEQIIILESGGDLSRDSELEMEDVILLVKQHASDLISKMFGEGFVSEGNVTPDHHFIQTYYDVAIQKDNARGIHYIEIPDVPMSLPENGGVQDIYPQNNFKKKFIQVESGQEGFMEGILSNSELERAYTLERKRAVFYHLKKNSGKVTLKIISVHPLNVGRDTEFYFPLEYQKMVIASVKAELATTKPMDKVNDNYDSTNG